MKSSKTTIDLSKCKPGQKLRMRNGSTLIFHRFASEAGYKFYPARTECGNGFTKNGYYWKDETPCTYDIIAILPLKRSKPRPRLSPSKGAKASQNGWKRDLRVVYRELRKLTAKVEKLLK